MTTPRIPPLPLALLTALLLPACGGGGRGPGTLVGEAFLAEDIDRQVNLPGTAVRLIPEPGEHAALDSALARLCPTREGPVADPHAAQAAAWAARARLLAPRARRVVTTDSLSRFVVDSVAPGRYRLWADTTVGRVRWTWLLPVQVAAGETARVELSNANPDENPFRCGPRTPPA